MSIENDILDLVRQADPANPLAYVHDIVRDLSRQKLDQFIADCSDCSERCSLPRSITKGPTNATIMVVGECVSSEQANDPSQFQVKPLEGTKAEELLHKVFDYYNVNKDDIFYINSVNCFTYKEVNDKVLFRTPSKTECQNCKVFLDYAIDVVKPAAIILLGSIALNMFQKMPISQGRGNWIDIKGIPAMPTYHPQYFLEIEGHKDPDLIQGLKDDFCEDIYTVLRYVEDNYPENNILLQPLPND